MYSISEPYTTTMYILKPTETLVKGVVKKTFSTIEESKKINCLFKTYGGTVTSSSSEKATNGIIAVIDTATVETWYNTDITSDCRLALDKDNIYEILGSAENISLRNKTMKIKLKKVVGGA